MAARQAAQWLSLLLALVAALAGCGGPVTARAAVAGAGPAATASAGSIPAFDHVFIIVLENHSFSEVYRSAAFPYLNRLAATAAVATNYYAITHPSLPNYLALLGGSTFGITSDCTACSVSGPNLVDELEKSDKSWKAYMEDLPAPCSTVATAGGYAKKHDPFMYFTDIAGQPARCANVVPLTALAPDLAAGKAPNFAWITPNLCHDMHDCDAAAGDAWLASFVPALLRSSAMQGRAALFITFDEGGSNDASGCCRLAAGGHVLTLVAGPTVRAGAVVAVPYDHYSLLRTIEDAWRLPHLGSAGDAGTSNMAACFKTLSGQ